MKFIKDLKAGERIADIFMCKHKQSATNKNGKEYYSVILQDKTGTIDAKIWEPNSEGIDEFDSPDCIDVFWRSDQFQRSSSGQYKKSQKVP